MGETAKLHSDLETLVGSTIHDRYEVETLLGAGGMGAVFRGQHTGLQRGVAIKVLHPEIGRDASTSKRFDREAHSASRLDHPNCVRVTDFGTTENGTKYLVMELLEGGGLDQRLGKPWPAQVAVDVIKQVLAGLEHAHTVGIVHRDLKPENIFISKDFKGEEVVKIVDFGIAKLLDEQGSEKLTRQGIVFGTPRYMSPEQAAGGKIDERTDLYAVGLILYELLAGHPPFQTDDAAQLLRMQIMAPPPPLPDSIPHALIEVVDKLLEKSKGDRFSTAREVLDALEDAALGLSPAAALAVGLSSEVASAAGLATAELSVAAPASSGVAWQPAPALAPGPAISGVTVAGSAADMAAVSLSAGAQSGPFGSGFGADLSGGGVPGVGASQSGMSVVAVAAPQPKSNSRTGLVLALAGFALLLVAGSVGAVWLGTDESGEADATAEGAAKPAADLDSEARPAAARKVGDRELAPAAGDDTPVAGPVHHETSPPARSPSRSKPDTPSNKPSTPNKSGDDSGANDGNSNDKAKPVPDTVPDKIPTDDTVPEPDPTDPTGNDTKPAPKPSEPKSDKKSKHDKDAAGGKAHGRSKHK